MVFIGIYLVIVFICMIWLFCRDRVDLFNFVLAFIMPLILLGVIVLVGLINVYVWGFEKYVQHRIPD